jgi:hypothetical protein
VDFCKSLENTEFEVVSVFMFTSVAGEVGSSRDCGASAAVVSTRESAPHCLGRCAIIQSITCGFFLSFMEIGHSPSGNFFLSFI